MIFDSNPRAGLMYRTLLAFGLSFAPLIDNESRERRRLHHTGFIVAEAKQIYRGYTNSDHGIDVEVTQIRSSKIEFRKKSEVRSSKSCGVV